MAVDIPPWLNSNPAAPAENYLRAYGQGAQIGEANRRGEQTDTELNLRASAQEFQQQQEERMSKLRETAQQIQLAEFGQNLQLKKIAAERQQKIAALQLEGQQGLQDDLDSGMTLEEAFPKWAPKLLASHPEAIGREAKALRPNQPPIFMPGTDETGPAHWESEGANGTHITVPPYGGDGEDPNEVVNYNGIPFVRNKRTGHVERLDRTSAPNASAIARTRAGILQHLLQSSADPDERAALTKELQGINADLQQMTTPAAKGGIAIPPPAEAPAAAEKSLSREQALFFLKLAQGDKEKARELAKKAGYTF